MARDPNAIQRDIDQARDALAATLDELGTKANPKRFVESGKKTVLDRLNAPAVRYALLGAAALGTLIVVRRIVR